MCCASSIFSLFGSVRRACAASDASSAATGFTAWRASSRLRKSSGVFRNEGSPFFFSLIVPPSPWAHHRPRAPVDSARMPHDLAAPRRGTLTASSPRPRTGSPAPPAAAAPSPRLVLPVAFVGRQHVRHLGDRLRQALVGGQVALAAVHHHQVEPLRCTPGPAGCPSLRHRWIAMRAARARSAASARTSRRPRRSARPRASRAPPPRRAPAGATAPRAAARSRRRRSPHSTRGRSALGAGGTPSWSSPLGGTARATRLRVVSAFARSNSGRTDGRRHPPRA